MSDIVYEKNVFSTPFLSGYSELRIPILDDSGKSAWPEVFPLETIQKLRESVGERHFTSQMLLHYVSPDRIRLDPGGIKLYESEFDIRTAKIGENLITSACVYWDPSSGRRNADNSVCALVYRDDKSQRFFIHDIMYMLVPDSIDYPLAYQCETVLEFIRRHKLRHLVLETNGIGNALPEIMRNIIIKTGYAVQIKPITNSSRKQDRILDSIEPILTTGRLYGHVRITQTPFISEMLAWNPIGGGEHDDGLDAVAGAISSASIAVHGMGLSPHHYLANTDFKI